MLIIIFNFLYFKKSWLWKAYIAKYESFSGENYSLWFCPLPFCPFALLPFCPFALLPFYPFCFLPLCPFVLLPSCHCPCPPMALFFLRFCGYQEKTFFDIVFTFRLMCRYRRLSWCYSCLQRWQLRPSSLKDKLRLCPFWLQILKFYLNIWRLGGGQGAGAGYHGILEYESPTPNIACFDIFSIKHDLARSCFQFWPTIGDEGNKILREKNWRGASRDSFFSKFCHPQSQFWEPKLKTWSRQIMFYVIYPELWKLLIKDENFVIGLQGGSGGPFVVLEILEKKS